MISDKKIKKALILGTGAYLPERILSNADLEKMVDTNDEWIVTRTGMKERRISAPGEYASNMGYEAALSALENAKLDKSAIDLIICATLTPDYIFPSTACLIQEMLGLTGVPAFDYQAACSGYIYGLSIAKAFVESGMYKNILLVASEKLTSIVDYTDRGTCVLFGDGAAACIVSSEREEGLEISSICLGADGSLADTLIMKGGGCRNPATHETVDQKLHFLEMDGKTVFVHAVRRMESAAVTCLELANVSQSEVSWLVPHQANIRIIDALAKRFEVPRDRVFTTVHKYGNTSASAVGIALHELLLEKNVLASERLLLPAFGAGLTWGCALLTKRTKK